MDTPPSSTTGGTDAEDEDTDVVRDHNAARPLLQRGSAVKGVNAEIFGFGEELIRREEPAQ